VIARTSAFAYKGKAVTVQQVGRELSVEYIVEGSVRTMADTVRITTQLIEVRTGRHLWAECYDRVLTDMFAVQDDLILQIVQALQGQLAAGEPARVWPYHHAAPGGKLPPLRQTLLSF
jgi:adenylate cyclase